MVLVIEIIVGSFLLTLSVIASVFTCKDLKKYDKIGSVICGGACLYFGTLGLIIVTGNFENAAQIINDILVMEI